jgi:hypothetical protein
MRLFATFWQCRSRPSWLALSIQLRPLGRFMGRCTVTTANPYREVLCICTTKQPIPLSRVLPTTAGTIASLASATVGTTEFTLSTKGWLPEYIASGRSIHTERSRLTSN